MEDSRFDPKPSCGLARQSSSDQTPQQNPRLLSFTSRATRMLANSFIFVNSLNLSSRLVAHSALSISAPLLQLFCRSEVAERLMWANRVVGFFPTPAVRDSARPFPAGSSSPGRSLRSGSVGRSRQHIQLRGAAIIAWLSERLPRNTAGTLQRDSYSSTCLLWRASTR